MKVIPLNIEKNVNKEWSDAKSSYETVKVINKIIKEQMKAYETFNVVNKKDTRMGLDEK